MNDLYKAKPKSKKVKTKNQAMKQIISLETNLPKEHQPAIETGREKPVVEKNQQKFTRQYPVRTNDQMFDRIAIAVATEGVKRGQPGQHGFNKTTMANEAFELWLEKFGY